MPRWYMEFQCYSNPQRIIEGIRRIVKRNNLGEIVPVVRVEKSVQHVLFYLFTSIESTTLGEIPAVVQYILLYLPVLRTRLPGSFTYEEIQGMVEGEHGCSQLYTYYSIQSFAISP